MLLDVRCYVWSFGRKILMTQPTISGKLMQYMDEALQGHNFVTMTIAGPRTPPVSFVACERLSSESASRPQRPPVMLRRPEQAVTYRTQALASVCRIFAP
ncbi:MAG TPA: hypothetical protein VGG75_30895 [Trebonia sp.]|jgi:hypothetical protein